MLDLTKFTTEQRNQRSMDLDTMTSLQIVTTMNDEDLRAVQSVTKVLPQVATAIDWTARRSSSFIVVTICSDVIVSRSIDL